MSAEIFICNVEGVPLTIRQRQPVADSFSAIKPRDTEYSSSSNLIDFLFYFLLPVTLTNSSIFLRLEDNSSAIKKIKSPRGRNRTAATINRLQV